MLNADTAGLLDFGTNELIWALAAGVIDHENLGLHIRVNTLDGRDEVHILGHTLQFEPNSMLVYLPAVSPHAAHERILASLLGGTIHVERRGVNDGCFFTFVVLGSDGPPCWL